MSAIDAGIPAYEAALKASGVDYQIFVYPGVNHAFNNDTSAARYDKTASDLAWFAHGRVPERESRLTSSLTASLRPLMSERRGHLASAKRIAMAVTPIT